MKRIRLLFLPAVVLAILCAPLPAQTSNPVPPPPLRADQQLLIAPAPPALTKEAVQKRLAELKTQYDKAVADANAMAGAMQDCQFWLIQLDPAKPAPKPEGAK